MCIYIIIFINILFIIMKSNYKMMNLMNKKTNNINSKPTTSILQENLFDKFINKSTNIIEENKFTNITTYDNDLYETLDYTDIKFMDITSETSLPQFKNNLSDKIILVIDFKKNRGGGSNVFLRSIIEKYKNNTMFVIVRKYKEISIKNIKNIKQIIDKYVVTINDEFLYSSNINIYDFIKNNIDNIQKIFVNHILDHLFEFLNYLFTLNKEVSCITHDFSLIYNKPNYLFNDYKIEDEIDINKFDINKFDIIITQNEKNLNIFNKFINNDKKIIISQLPDFKYSLDKIDIDNNDIITIGIIGIMCHIKGNAVLKILKNHYNSKNIKFVIFGRINDDDGINPNEIIHENYNTITDLNNLLMKYKPNLLLELSLWNETYCYSLTLSMLTQLPILSLKKNMDCVVENRLDKYFNTHYFTNIEEFDELINTKKQNYFYTIKSDIYYNKFWEEYFSI